MISHKEYNLYMQWYVLYICFIIINKSYFNFFRDAEMEDAEADSTDLEGMDESNAPTSTK
jgi:hypothetical protein